MRVRFPIRIHLPDWLRSVRYPSLQPGLSLRRKLLIAVAVILIPSLIIVLIGDLSDLGVRRANLVENNVTTAETVASLVDASIDDAVAVGQALAMSPATQTFDPRVLDPELMALDHQYLQFNGISVVNARGVSVAESVPYQPGQPRVSVADRPFFQKTMEFDTPQVSSILISRHIEQKTAIVSVPIEGAAGRPIGAVLISLNLDYFRVRLWSVPLNRGQVIVITDPTGQVAFASNRWSITPSVSSLADNPLIGKAMDGLTATQVRGSFPLTSGSQIGAAVPSPRYGWVAAVVQPSAVAEEPVISVFILDLASFLLALLLGVVATLYLAHQILGPIRQLVAVAREWTQGHLDVRTDIRTGDELQVLGERLNEMAAALENTLDRLSRAMKRLARADRQLTQERNRLQSILETSPAAIITIDKSARIILANSAAEALVEAKLTPGEPLKKALSHLQVLRPNGTRVPYEENPLTESLQEGVTITGAELVYRHANGFETHILANTAPLRGPNGQIVGAVKVFFDITPLAEEERLRREFILSAAHEFRHPLTVIKGYAEVAERNPAVRGTRVYGDLSRIVSAASEANKLSDQLLRAAELHVPPLVLHYQRIDLARLIKDTVATFERSLPKTPAYHIVVKTEPAQVNGDPKLLAEATTDLLRQARGAMPEGGKIDVDVTTWDGVANVAITDHGPEVPAREIPNLFQPFTGLPSTAAQRGRRSTLLLYLAKRIVEESGGWIRAESSPNGTTITISLPRLSHVALPTPSGHPPTAAPTAASATENPVTKPGGA